MFPTNWYPLSKVKAILGSPEFSAYQHQFNLKESHCYIYPRQPLVSPVTGDNVWSPDHSHQLGYRSGVGAEARTGFIVQYYVAIEELLGHVDTVMERLAEKAWQ
ncbi:hypothetical protein MNV49_001423 [Pseudohyphozyma bogoriensis]|nr:hypothetical protein MNV49_001423 [Pseudohyphozyma bogoriensis]